MARGGHPDALRMRTLKYGDPREAERDRVAEALRADGRRSEAVLMYERLPEHPFLDEEQAWAVETGDAFHLLALRRIGRSIPDDAFRACARQAEAAGRWLDARQCYLAVADPAALERIAEHLPTSLRPAAPAEDAAD
jgi:hypothetical protein